MAISDAVRKRLWALSGNLCAFPGCDQSLIVDAGTSPEEAVAEGLVVGEQAHIRSGKSGGPRHDASYDRVDQYENLILLCSRHHTIIDKDNGSLYSVDTLLEIKSNHEAAIRDRMSSGDAKRLDLELRTLNAVGEWEKKACLDKWQTITSWLSAPIPRINEEYYASLSQLGVWLLSKDWPLDFPRLRAAFAMHRKVLGDFFRFDGLAPDIYHEYKDGTIAVPRDYHHLPEWNPPLYEELLAQFKIRASVVDLMTVELTKSINYVISAVRSDLDSFYRFDEGVVLHVQSYGFDGEVVRYEFEFDNDGKPVYEGLQTIEERATARFTVSKSAPTVDADD